MNKLIPTLSWQTIILIFTNKYIGELGIVIANYFNVFLYKKYKFNNYILLINKSA